MEAQGRSKLKLPSSIRACATAAGSSLCAWPSHGGMLSGFSWEQDWLAGFHWHGMEMDPMARQRMAGKGWVGMDGVGPHE